MSDTISSLKQLKKLYYDLTVAMIVSSPIADVRHSWPKEGAPAWGINDNVIFLKIFDEESAVTGEREREYTVIGSPTTLNEAASYTRTLHVNWIFYGPDAWDAAKDVRNAMYTQAIRDQLAQSNIYVIPKFPPAKRMPELFQGMWYERYDLDIKFNELVVINTDVNYIESAEIVVM